MNNRKNKNLQKLFEQVKKGNNGFNVESVKPHLDIFVDYASKCRTVTEFGVETGCSTLAFLMSTCQKVYSYDVIVTPNARMVKEAADADGRFFRLYEKNNLHVKIRKTDMLFIDTDHWYGQIKAELEHHHSRVRKWILMHDTETFGLINPFDGRPGMKAAIYEFMEAHPEWQIKEHFEVGHGLTILENTIPKKWWW
jgi:predicted O-methyltransferase YrrM